MAHSANISVVVLWEHELRLAAKTLESLRDSLEKDGEGEMSHETAVLYGQALNVCSAALFGIKDGSAIVVSSVPKPANGAKRA